ncbi:hypothetical protein M433DRAFT_154115 [Acidomyces richmondensis BFW]|nr:MAG: hypothetical protein FE78DRAFT_90012 [Acidomyces sp. 'richmondensis']KYG45809.1 hypothetical protein M433DRAFT_154115 [Acidomyces richmondensis BFW]
MVGVEGSDEERDLLNRCGSKEEDVAEQEQRLLLASWKENESVEDGAGRTKLPDKRRAWSCKGWATITAGFTVALLVSAGLVLLLGQAAISPKNTPSDVRHNDYLLDRTWDNNAAPQRREYYWEIRDCVHNPDGVYRPMMLVNNQFPGPLIEVNEGDTIVVHVNNQAANATSIHWHGIYQKGTPHMDGTVGVTQCPIAPGEKFTYEFNVSGQSGTYWWHAHHGVQSSDGLHGPLIIHGRGDLHRERISYDTDRVILVSDHYHDLSSALLWQYLAPDMENTEPVPDGGLINGRSIRDCDRLPQRRCDNTSVHVGHAEFDMAPDQNHRLRFINVGSFAEFQVQIDEHELGITEVDGTEVHPVNYHRLNISPGQRYSVTIATTVKTADSFWLRARMITTCFKRRSKTLEPDVFGILRYSRSADKPKSTDWDDKLALKCKDMNTTELIPTEILPAPPQADAYFYLRSNFEIGAWRLSRGVFNGSSWRASARSPTLLRTLDGLLTNNTSFTPVPIPGNGRGAAFVNDVAFDISRELVVQTTGMQVIDLLISNFDDGAHPLHLHGYKYFVLAEGHGYPPKQSVFDELTRDNVQPLYDSLDLSNPLRRDTASVEGFGWILIRIVADNPGVWAFHCHVSWHTEAGLLMQFLTRSDELAKLEAPAASLKLCSAKGIERGMGPKDEDYRDLAK